MSRIKQTIAFFLVIAMGGAFCLWNNDYFLSQKSALHTEQLATHYEPSEEIVFQYENSDGAGVIAGQVSDGIFVINTKRVGPFVKITDIQLFSDDGINVYFDAGMKSVYGYVADENTETVYYYFNNVGAFPEGENDWKRIEKTVEVGGRRFFLEDHSDFLQNANPKTLKSGFATKIVCKDAEGNEIYKTIRDNSGSTFNFKEKRYIISGHEAGGLPPVPRLILQDSARWNEYMFYYESPSQKYSHGPYSIRDDVLICENYRFRIIDERTLEYLGDGMTQAGIAGVDIAIGTVLVLEE